jgi:hypothetical protein
MSSRPVLKRRPLKKSKSESKSMTSAPPRLPMLGQPQLLVGENADLYDELLARFSAAANPADIFDEMFIREVVALQWEVLRWRRLKLSLLQAAAVAQLKAFLRENLPYERCSDRFADRLIQRLQDCLPDGAEDAEELARAYLRDESDAVEKVMEVLAKMGHINALLEEDWENARNEKAEELAQQYARGESATVTLIRELLTDAGMTMDELVADALAKKLDYIERIDRLTMSAENRRNSSLREIERRHALLGQTLRRSVQAIEEGEYEVVEPKPDKGKSAT